MSLPRKFCGSSRELNDYETKVSGSMVIDTEFPSRPISRTPGSGETMSLVEDTQREEGPILGSRSSQPPTPGTT